MTQPLGILTQLFGNKHRIIHHVLFVGVIITFWFLFDLEELRTLFGFIRAVLYSATFILVAYLNIYVLFPLLIKGKIGLYILFSLCSFIISYVTQQLIYFKSIESFSEKFTLATPLVVDMAINSLTHCMFIGIGLSVRMLKMWINSQVTIWSLEKENLQANLSNLKNQLSPHFLFNTFNNLYVLSKTNPGIASEMILGFSDLMRYQLNECEKDKVDLENEIRYINNFLSLEKLRKDNLDIKVNYDQTRLHGVQIEPLLLATFIENAIKHGSQQMEDPFIHVFISREENTLLFQVINSKPAVSLMDGNGSPGKGLDNLKRRLQLAYPQKHKLDLCSETNLYKAKLEIQLL